MIPPFSRDVDVIHYFRDNERDIQSFEALFFTISNSIKVTLLLKTTPFLAIHIQSITITKVIEMGYETYKLHAKSCQSYNNP